MSNLFDIPAGLMFVLSLVTSAPGETARQAGGIALQQAATANSIRQTPCRFTDQAWLAALKEGAGGGAYAELSSRIFKTSAGRYYVPSRTHRMHIFAVRRDTAASCFIALSAAASNVHLLKQTLRIEPGIDELYLAHVFGARQATAIIQAIKLKPRSRMANLFPNLDQRAPGLYAGKGARMTMARFADRLTSAIRTKVAKETKRNKITRLTRTKPHRRPVTSQRKSKPFAAKKVSARDINRKAVRILNWSADPPKPLAQTTTPVDRFKFASGLVRKLFPQERPLQPNEIAF